MARILIALASNPYRNQAGLATVNARPNQTKMSAPQLPKGMFETSSPAVLGTHGGNLGKINGVVQVVGGWAGDL